MSEMSGRCTTRAPTSSNPSTKAPSRTTTRWSALHTRRASTSRPDSPSACRRCRRSRSTPAASTATLSWSTSTSSSTPDRARHAQPPTAAPLASGREACPQAPAPGPTAVVPQPVAQSSRRWAWHKAPGVRPGLGEGPHVVQVAPRPAAPVPGTRPAGRSRAGRRPGAPAGLLLPVPDVPTHRQVQLQQLAVRRPDPRTADPRPRGPAAPQRCLAVAWLLAMLRSHPWGSAERRF